MVVIAPTVNMENPRRRSQNGRLHEAMRRMDATHFGSARTHAVPDRQWQRAGRLIPECSRDGGYPNIYVSE